MKLSKSQKIWVGLLGIGVGALVIDQAVGRETSVITTAIESITTMAAGETPNAAPKSESPAAAAAERFAARLRVLAAGSKPLGTVRDAFVSNAGESEMPAPAVRAVETTALNESADRFLREHTLRGIVHTPGESRAWVDGRLIEVGQRLGEARLVSAEGLTAVFDLGGRSVTLSLPDATPQPPAKAASAAE